MRARPSGTWRTWTGFFETFVLEQYEANFKPFDPSFRVLYNSYNGISWVIPHPAARHGQPPWRRCCSNAAVDERAYTAHFRRGTAAVRRWPSWSPWSVIHRAAAIQEPLLTDIKHALSCTAPMGLIKTLVSWRRQLRRSRCATTAHAGGLVHDFDPAHDGSFGFDNENAFAIMRLRAAIIRAGEPARTMASSWSSWPMAANSDLTGGWPWLGLVQGPSRARAMPLYWEGMHSSNFTLQGVTDSNTPPCAT
jgi:hypothetical protein